MAVKGCSGRRGRRPAGAGIGEAVLAWMRLAERLAAVLPFALGLAMLAPVQAPAGDGADASGPVRLVTGPDYAPFTGSDLPGGGLITEIVREIHKLLGHEVEIDFRPWRRGYLETLAGQYRATFPYVRTPEREAKFFYSDPVFETSIYPFVIEGTHMDAGKLADLAGKHYCFPLGYALTGKTKRLTENGELVREAAVSMKRCFELLFHDRVDFVIANRIQAYQATQDLDSSRRIEALDILVNRTGLHVMFPRNQPGSADSLRDFNRAMRRFKQTRRYNAVLKRHLPRMAVIARTP